MHNQLTFPFSCPETEVLDPSGDMPPDLKG